MEFKQIKELMAAMERCGTSKVHVKNGSFELLLERVNGSVRSASESMDSEAEIKPLFGSGPRRESAPLPRANDAASLHSMEDKKAEVPGTFITSPMVGTFYAASSPDDPDFVKVGDSVEKGTIVCIIEAMKVLNEIKSPHSGTIAEVLVENGQPVEFGTKLFRIQTG